MGKRWIAVLAVGLAWGVSFPARAADFDFVFPTWIQQFGQDGADYAGSVAVDTRGFILVGGALGTGGPFPDPSSSTGFVHRFDLGGRSQAIPTVSSTSVLSVVGAAGSVDSLAYDLPADMPYLSRYAETGLPLPTRWTVALAPMFGGIDVARRFDVDTRGNCYVGTRDRASGQAYLTKYAAYDGSVARVTDLGAGVQPRAVDVDAGENVFVAGRYQQDPSSLMGDLYLARFDAAGNEVWAVRDTISYLSGVSDVAADAEGNVYVTYGLSGNYVFPSSVVAKYDAAGNEVWSKVFARRANGLAVGPTGDVYVVGTDFSAPTFPTTESAAILRVFNPAGTELWSDVLSTSGRKTEGLDVAVSGDGRVYVVGSTTGDLGRPNAGQSDAFLAYYGGIDTRFVRLDIRPGGDPEKIETINLNSHGVLPVAIFGRDGFDLTEIELDSLLLQGAAPRQKGNGRIGDFRDVNGDGILDLVLQFSVEDMTFGPGDESIELTGRLWNGIPLWGSDDIRLQGGRLTADDLGRAQLVAIPEPACLAILSAAAGLLRHRRFPGAEK